MAFGGSSLLFAVATAAQRDAPHDVVKTTLKKVKKRKLEETEYTYQDGAALLSASSSIVTALCRDEKEDVLSSSLEEMF